MSAGIGAPLIKTLQAARADVDNPNTAKITPVAIRNPSLRIRFAFVTKNLSKLSQPPNGCV
jgi:hypothetical protein